MVCVNRDCGKNVNLYSHWEAKTGKKKNCKAKWPCSLHRFLRRLTIDEEKQIYSTRKPEDLWLSNPLP